MLTSAGVSAIDGNDKISGGFYGEFKLAWKRTMVDLKNMATGWVSNTLFEPKVANELPSGNGLQDPKILRFHIKYLEDCCLYRRKMAGDLSKWRE